MPHSERELRSTLDQLRAQLHAADALDPELRARLRDAIGEIEAALAASGPHEPSLRDRYGVVEDPFGHQWAFSTHKKDLTPEQIAKAQAEAFRQGPPKKS